MFFMLSLTFWIILRFLPFQTFHSLERPEKGNEREEQNLLFKLSSPQEREKINANHSLGKNR